MSDTAGSDQVLRALIPLLGASEAAAAIGASLRLRQENTTSAMSAQLDGVLDALGIREALADLDAHEAAAVLGLVEAFLAQATDFVANPGRDAWDHEDATILTAQGRSSELIATTLQRFVVPALGGDIATRLESPGACCLDVGAGIGAWAVAMCRLWPSLRVVGIDPLEPALALGREHVAAAGVQERVELRATRVEALDDADCYDLAWLPTFFIPSAALDESIGRIHAALRPGGWAVLGMYGRPGVPFIDALGDLRTVRQGGTLRTAQEFASSLEGGGFENVAIHASAEWMPPLAYIAGQRPGAS